MIKVKYRHGRKNTLASLNEDKGYVFRLFLVVIFLTACAIAVLKIISTVLPHMWGIISYFPLVILGALIYMGGNVRSVVCPCRELVDIDLFAYFP